MVAFVQPAGNDDKPTSSSGHLYLYIMGFSTSRIYYIVHTSIVKFRRGLCFSSTKSDFSFGMMESKKMYSNGNHWPSESFPRTKTNGLWKNNNNAHNMGASHPYQLLTSFIHLHIPVTNRFYLSATLESTSSY